MLIVNGEQYHIYLFERILLCCKDINPNKQKKLIPGNNRPSTTAKGKARLQLKGRIYMANVTDIVCLQKPGTSCDNKKNYTQKFVAGDVHSLISHLFIQAPIVSRSFGKATPAWWTISLSSIRMRTACANGTKTLTLNGQFRQTNAAPEAPVLPKPNSCT